MMMKKVFGKKRILWKTNFGEQVFFVEKFFVEIMFWQNKCGKSICWKKNVGYKFFCEKIFLFFFCVLNKLLGGFFSFSSIQNISGDKSIRWICLNFLCVKKYFFFVWKKSLVSTVTKFTTVTTVNTVTTVA